MRAPRTALVLVALACCTRTSKDESGSFDGQLSGTYAPARAAAVDMKRSTLVAIRGSAGGAMTVDVLGCSIPVTATQRGPTIASSGELPVPPCSIEVAGHGTIALTDVSLQIQLDRSNDKLELTMTARGPDRNLMRPPDLSITFQGTRR